MSSNIVYVVHNVDTEGPLHESLKATFGRIQEMTGFNIEATDDNKEEETKTLGLKLIGVTGSDEIEQQSLQTAVIKIIDNDSTKNRITLEKIDESNDFSGSFKFVLPALRSTYFPSFKSNLSSFFSFFFLLK